LHVLTITLYPTNMCINVCNYYMLIKNKQILKEKHNLMWKWEKTWTGISENNTFK
jgi:hypothetical protein